MAGTTYSKFFWADWRAKPALQLCSLAARGLWIEMLTLMADTPDASVRVNGAAATIPQIAELCRHRGQDVEPLLAELEANGVFSRDADGVIYSRRMRKDLLKLRRSSAGGKKSAAVRRSTGKLIPTTSKGVLEVGALTTINHQPESINHQPQKPPPTFEEKIRKVDRLGSVLGVDLTTARNGHRFIGDLARLQADGFDFDLDILPAVEARRASGAIPRDLASLEYFRKPIEAQKEARLLALAATQARAAAPLEDTDAIGWDKRLKYWLEGGYWPAKYGPRPRSGECAAAPDRVAIALARWEEQGGHPTGAFPADPNGRFQEWKNLRDLRDDPSVDYGNRALNVVAMPRRTGS